MLCNASTLAKQGAFQPLSANDGILIADDKGKIFSHNHIATSLYRILGVYQLNGRYLSERQLNLRFAEAAEECHVPQSAEIKYRNIMLSQRSIPIVADGKVVRVIVLVTDITEIKKKEKELLIKSAVIQEIHHRVKNNLQTIASLLRMQARRADSEQVQAALNESINRILSISVVHEFLSQQDAETIDIAEVAKNILELLAQNMLAPDFRLQTVFDGETAILPSEQASNLAIVINELVQNSIEHGFKGRMEGTIGINISLTDDSCYLEIYDNGNGLPSEAETKKRKRKSLGTQIIRTLIEDDMGGEFALVSDGGTRAKIRIPRRKGGR
jgi:two-component sensor histidine kinase